MEDCIFCKIANGETDATLILETDSIAAFDDIQPKAPVHILVVPKRHIVSLNEADDRELLSDLLVAAKDVAQKRGIAQSGYKLAMNVGEGGGQVVSHLHLHVLGGWSQKPGALDL